MNQSLNLRIGQQLKMTPQLQHAIRMLQLSAIELQQEVQEIMESNPLLEEGEEESSSESNQENSNENKEKEAASSSEESSTEASTEPDNSLPEELDSDSNWEDTYDIPSMLGNSSGSGEQFEPQEVHSASGSLQDHLIWQLNALPLSDRDFSISITILDAINGEGYLEESLEELLATFDQDPEVEMEELVTQLKQIQQFDPPGVGAKDLQECLLIQLKQLNDDSEARDIAQEWVEHHFKLIASLNSKQSLEQISKKLRATPEVVTEALALIRTLDPKPGEQIAPAAIEYVVPDLIVQKRGEHWEIELTPETSPKLRISPFYQTLKSAKTSGDEKEYISHNIQEARWFLKSLQNRNETLFKVASHIFQMQSEFLEEGPAKMKALTLKTIADAIEMHESTISRVTTSKYAQTPQGIFELKYFFSSQLSTADGDGTSGTAVRAMIKQIVDEEDPAKPTSDNKIAQMLAEKGVKVARRTVAKYRDILSIPPSNERKRSM
ncbi:MAG: RNA polymerase factor sigma-54 [Gammaproteobacteria bacterium]|nr:RNA polymerase factor sigma-54 [Gammaproteobacteria bacterium]MBT4606611.1 RNA polymerase factor sigma-54 [Thiotrichales bacterium]MBT3473420.1 RNA polymerase factor sigma-54 [Gammaproteobacteria bacterium]MBT4081227.1 RNA polymerase factor sigma-54 [Gammaproteobacteria bacterium]MBT4330076.1 RNA polymerase factor sigma-54 [Gammaproteobacteria bacterium]